MCIRDSISAGERFHISTHISVGERFNISTRFSAGEHFNISTHISAGEHFNNISTRISAGEHSNIISTYILAGEHFNNISISCLCHTKIARSYFVICAFIPVCHRMHCFCCCWCLCCCFCICCSFYLERPTPFKTALNTHLFKAIQSAKLQPSKPHAFS